MNRQPLAAKKWHRSDIVFPILQHSDCNSLFADMLSLFNNTSMMATIRFWNGGIRSTVEVNEMVFNFQIPSEHIDLRVP